MCGRYSLFTEQDNQEILKIVQELDRKYPGNSMRTGEIYPTNLAPVLLAEEEQIIPELSSWGFPHFRGSGVIINARAETAEEKRMFRDSLLFRRLAVPTTGFYEWDREKKKHRFLLPGESTLYLAGFYKLVKGERRYVILTTAANDSIANVHDRMPVILPRKRIRDWIFDTDRALGYLKEKMPALEDRKAE